MLSLTNCINENSPSKSSISLLYTSFVLDDLVYINYIFVNSIIIDSSLDLKSVGKYDQGNEL